MCARNRQEKAFEFGRRKIGRELDLIEFIKQKRGFKLAIKRLQEQLNLDKNENLEVKERSRYVRISQKDMDQLSSLSDEPVTSKNKSDDKGENMGQIEPNQDINSGILAL